MARLPLETAEHVLRRIERANREVEAGAVVFDADGTLWTGDVGVDVFEALLRQRAIRAEAGEELSAEAGRAGVDVCVDPSRQAALLYAAFARHAYPEDRAYAMMTWAFAGFETEEARSFARRTLIALGIEHRTIGEARFLFEACRARGLAVYVVSASPRPVVESALALAALVPDGLAAMTPQVNGDRILASVAKPWPYAEGKVIALKAIAGDRSIVAAFGDSSFDVPMLATARIAVAVRPKPALLARGGEVPGMVELQRA